MRPLILGSPSICLYSSRVSCTVIFCRFHQRSALVDVVGERDDGDDRERRAEDLEAQILEVGEDHRRIGGDHRSRAGRARARARRTAPPPTTPSLTRPLTKLTSASRREQALGAGNRRDLGEFRRDRIERQQRPVLDRDWRRCAQGRERSAAGSAPPAGSSRRDPSKNCPNACAADLDTDRHWPMQDLRATRRGWRWSSTAPSSQRSAPSRPA